MKILLNDKIQVLIGRDKNRQGQVVKTFPKSRKIIVKGVNVSKKHVKSTQNNPGGIIDKEMPMPVSKVALICPKCNKPTRIGYTTDTSGKKVRTCRKCKVVIDQKSLIKKVVKSKKIDKKTTKIKSEK